MWGKGDLTQEPTSQSHGNTVKQDGDVSAIKDTEGTESNPTNSSSPAAALLAQQLSPLPNTVGNTWKMNRFKIGSVSLR